MPSFIYSGLEIIFGGGLAEKLSDWMSGLFESVQDVFDGDLVGIALTLFAGIACSLLVIYFFMDLVGQVQRDMFSFEKLIVAFIKLFVAFAVLLCLKEIINGILSIGHYLYKYVESSSFRSSMFSTDGLFTFRFGSYSGNSFPEWSEVQAEFEDQYGGISGFFNGIGLFGVLIIPTIIGLIVQLAGYFITTSNAVMIIARAIFSPIAIVQLFDEGQRSTGIRYLKKFAAECITMAVIVIILYACSMVTGTVMANYGDFQDLTGNAITFENIGQVVKMSNLAIMIVPELVAIGSIMGAAKLTNDIVGAA